jgi:membrane protein implicated in regulation of membrane protease activity
MFENIPAELLWFILGFALLLLELATPAFIMMFFGIGAWVTSAATFFGVVPRTDLQIVLFVAVSLLTLALFRKGGRKSRGHVAAKTRETGSMDTMAGNLATVTESIEPGSLSGRVELFGTQWQAVSDEPISKGSVVEVVSRDNLTLKVKTHL